MSADLSQANPTVEPTPSSISTPEPTGTVVAPDVPPVTPADTLPTFEPPADDDNIAPPEGTSPAQRENWNKLEASRNSYREQATQHREQVAQLETQLAAFEGILDESTKFADITRRPDIADQDVYEFEQLLFELNQPLWEGLVRKAVERYGPQITGQNATPPPADQPAGVSAPPVNQAGAALPDGFDSELEYLTEANPAVAQKILAALEAEKKYEELSQRLQQVEDRHSAETSQQKDFNHDLQFSEYVVGMFEQAHIPRTVHDPVKNTEVVNPVLVKWIEDLMNRVESDPVAGADLERSRRAFRGDLGNQKAALPALGAKVKAAIRRVFDADVAPRLGSFAPPPSPIPGLTPDELRARASAQPPPTPGGAAAPVPGQYKELPLQERIKMHYRNNRPATP